MGKITKKEEANNLNLFLDELGYKEYFQGFPQTFEELLDFYIKLKKKITSPKP